MFKGWIDAHWFAFIFLLIDLRGEIIGSIMRVDYAAKKKKKSKRQESKKANWYTIFRNLQFLLYDLWSIRWIIPHNYYYFSPSQILFKGRGTPYNTCC